MKKQMKKTMVLFILIGIIFSGLSQAKDTVETTTDQNKQHTSSSYKNKVNAILSEYKASSLTEADAKAINNAFRNAGIKRGPEQQEAIKAAGFDPQKISSLDPPPEKSSKGNRFDRKKVEN